MIGQRQQRSEHDRYVCADGESLGDTPSVTNASTTVNTQSTSGLVITKNAVDGAEITHFKITSITNGTLFKDDGATQISNGDFINAGRSGAGLKFHAGVELVATGSFDVQAAPGNDGSGLSSAATATITVGCGPTVVTTNGDSGAGMFAGHVFFTPARARRSPSIQL
jgi:hypothetical protein